MIWVFVYITGAIQGLFLAGLLYSTRHSRWPGNVFLGILSAIVAILLGVFSARVLLGTNIPAFLFWPFTALPALIGPCLYFYLQSLLIGTRPFTKTDLLHTIPLIIVIVTYLPETVIAPSKGLIHLDDSATMLKTFYLSYGKSLQLLAYLIYCFWILGRVSDGKSIQEPARKFFRTMLVLFILTTLTGSSLTTLYWLEIYSLPLPDRIELSFLAIYIYLLAFYVYYFDVRPKHPKHRYLSSALTDTARQDIATQLIQYMDTEQPFLNGEFKLVTVAEHLNISEHYLSEVLALKLNTNFNAFANQYRLNQFEHLVCLDEFSDKPVIDIAFAAGFNSKSSFHRIVKEVSGLTPGAFRKQIQGH